MGTWEEIGTAPKDRFILLWYNDSTVVGYWDASRLNWRGRMVPDDYGVLHEGLITHWMELPSGQSKTKPTGK